jgi:hypothetical protein
MQVDVWSSVVLTLRGDSVLPSVGDGAEWIGGPLPQCKSMINTSAKTVVLHLRVWHSATASCHRFRPDERSGRERNRAVDAITFDLSSPSAEVDEASTECKRERLHASIEELDLESAIEDRSRLSD